MSSTSIASLTRASELSPDDATAWLALGRAWRSEGRPDQASESLLRAVRLRPDWAPASYELGLCLRDLGEAEPAAMCLERATDAEPLEFDYQLAFARALERLGQRERALAHFQCALALGPERLEPYRELSRLLRQLKRHAAAASVLAKAVALSPSAPVYNDLGNALRDAQRLDDALAAYRRAVELDPSLALAHANLGVALKDAGLMSEAVAALRRALELDPRDSTTRSALLFSLSYLPGVTPEILLEEAKAFGREHCEALRPLRLPHKNDKNPQRRLRIGYVSADFREHVALHYVLPLLERHDRKAFDVYCYANVERPDRATNRFRKAAKVFRDILPLDDEQAARIIREDRIDVLVDLTLHSSNPRPLVFARRPAPVQVGWFAYPGTTGIDGLDYRFTDPYLDPAERDLSLYTEASQRLSRSFWCYDPQTTGPEVGPSPARANGFVTFGCLNNFCKVNEPTLELWTRVLQRVPGSRLLLLVPQGEARRRAEQVLARGGVQQAVTFVSRMQRADYLAAYNQVDLGLDTLPYGGHTTSLDALWMGVPTVTLIGSTVASRAGLSFAMNLDLPEVVAHSPEDFVDRAAALAGDLEALGRLRATLRDRFRQSPLMDMRGYTQELEGAYRAMWSEWCRRAD